MADQNIQMHHWNGTSWDNEYPYTKAENVSYAEGNVRDFIELMNNEISKNGQNINKLSKEYVTDVIFPNISKAYRVRKWSDGQIDLNGTYSVAVGNCMRIGGGYYYKTTINLPSDIGLGLITTKYTQLTVKGNTPLCISINEQNSTSITVYISGFSDFSNRNVTVEYNIIDTGKII